MEWNLPRPHHQLAFPHQPTPRHWYPYYENDEDEESQEQPPYATVLQTDRFADVNDMMAQGANSPLEAASASTFGNEGVMLQPLRSSGMPQLEESTEFQSFTSGKKSAYADNSTISPTLPMLSSPPQQLLEQQVPTQFSAQFPEFPPGTPGLYRPSMPSPSASIMAPATIRPAEYFAEAGISTLYSVHNSVPSLPASFGAVQQRQAQLVLGERVGDSELASNMAYPSPMTPADSTMLPRFPVGNFPVGNYPGEQASSVCTPPPAYASMPALGRARRDSGLSEPFSRMATAREPKFSPDRRKLCCVEGCKSQARAFNRCKRHGGSKRCSSPGCTKSVQSRGLCIRHGGGSRCTEIGCTRASQSHGRCKMHGGGRPCIVPGCEKKAHLKRLCRRHGGGAKCTVRGCDKWAQRLGMCMTHAKGGPELSGFDHMDESADFDRNSTPPPSTADSTPPPSLEMLTHEV